MEENLKLFMVCVSVTLTCIILSIFLFHQGRAREADSDIVDIYDEQKTVILTDDLANYNNKTITAEKCIDLIYKYQNDLTIGFKTEKVTKYYSKANPKVNNSPAATDYVNPKWMFNVKLVYARDSLVSKLLLTEIGSYPDGTPISIMLENEMNDAFVMFTESGEFTVPDGVSNISISACASGKGIKAGEFIGADSDYVIPVNAGDKLTISIQYLGDTVIYKNGTQLVKLRAGIISDSHESSVLGYRTGISGQDGDNGLLNGVRITASNGDTNYDGLGGKGGAGGAFGYGGGGGAGATCDTYDQIVVDASNAIVNYTVSGTEASPGSCTLTELAPVVRAVGGKGSASSSRWETAIGYSAYGEDGKNGTLYSGGAGGSADFTTEKFNPSNVILNGNNPLTMFSAISGAGGGGGAGGFGAGGGEGGHGMKDLATVYEYYNPDTDETTYFQNIDALTEVQKKYCTAIDGILVEKGGDGSPTGGMVYLYCY